MNAQAAINKWKTECQRKTALYEAEKKAHEDDVKSLQFKVQSVLTYDVGEGRRGGRKMFLGLVETCFLDLVATACSGCVAKSRRV
jgi:hypothetical protein